MNERKPYGKLYNYPHLKPFDVAIWERFITLYPDAYDDCIYDQPVGSGAPIPEGTQENIARDFKILTQWKVDVIGYKNNKADVIEIKPNAGIAALGQVAQYAVMVDELDELTIPVRPVLITDVLRPDMQRLADKAGVRLIVV